MMHLKTFLCICFGLLSFLVEDVWAIIYKCVDDSDAVVLSNIKKNDPNLKCTKMDLPRASDSTKKLANGSMLSTDMVKSDTNSHRQRIIEDEIALESKRLQDVKAKIAALGKKEGKAKPGSELEVIEKERLLHEKNIEILKKELAR
jgi:hypothetical protein